MNEELLMTLDDAVTEVLGALTGLDLEYQPELDRYRAITRALNRALRLNALEKEWSYYSSTYELGTVDAGTSSIYLPASLRPRMISDDAVRLNDDDGVTRMWAYFLPRDALHKYRSRGGLWCSVTLNQLDFSRPFRDIEQDLHIMLPVMREPTMFRLPAQPEDPEADLEVVPDEIREQPVDFAYPDLIVLRAAYLYAQTDPIMQPRVQTLEAQYKDLMYQIIERDTRNTDTPYMNEWRLPIQSSLAGPEHVFHGHPWADERW